VKVRILTPALREIIAALEYYEGQASGLACALDADVTRSLEFVVANPLLGSPFQGGTRRRFPYTIVYRALDDEILVVALAHQKQRPGYWRDRI
jgi:plasmid stabilization system protein ParE